MQASQTLLDASHTTDLKMETGLARKRKVIVLSLQILTRLQEVAGSGEISLTCGTELVSKNV